MELVDMIRELKDVIEDADVAADSGNWDGAKAHLREAKALLDDKLLAE